MIYKIKKYCIYLICMVLVCSHIQATYAAIDLSKRYVSKAEFNSVLADVNAKISFLEKNSNIEEEIDVYLSSNYYKKSEIDVLLNDKQNNILNISGSAGQILKRNVANDGLVFGDIDGDYYEKSEVDILLDDKQNNILDITGSANQVLKRNAANNGLEFGDIGDYYEKSEIDTLLANKQNNILSISGSANQYLRRNSSNNGLEFVTITTGHLYLHNIVLEKTSQKLVMVAQFINDVSTSYTRADFSDYLYTNGFTSKSKYLICYGYYNTKKVVGLYSSGGSLSYLYDGNSTGSVPDGNFVDTVYQIK